MFHRLLSYVPFFDPLPIWTRWYGWALTLIPLCAGVSIVYKSIKCWEMKKVPKEALMILAWIILGMVAAAGALAGLVHGLD